MRRSGEVSKWAIASQVSPLIRVDFLSEGELSLMVSEKRLSEVFTETTLHLFDDSTTEEDCDATAGSAANESSQETRSAGGQRLAAVRLAPARAPRGL